MPITYGDLSTSRQRDFTTSSVKSIEIVSIVLGTTYSAPLLIDYILESDVGASASVDMEYSTNGGTSFTDATALTSHASHSGTTGLAADADTEQFTFVWDVETDLGATYTGSTVVVRVRASDGSAFSSYATSPQFALSLIPSVSSSAPLANTTHGTPVLISYTITNNRAVTGTYSLTAEYSTNGSSYSTATPDTSHSSHSGISSLSAGAKTFVWNSVHNVTASYNNTVYVRLRVNDGSGNSAYATVTFAIDLTPTVEITAPATTSEEGSPILVEYKLTSNYTALSTFASTAQYSTNTSSPSYVSMTADTSHSSHSGTSNLTTGSKTFVWTPITNLGSVYANDVIVKVTASDGTNSVSDTQIFRVDLLPRTPTLVSPTDTYFDAGADLAFVWTIPTDPGGERMIQRIEVDDDNAFGSNAIDDNSNSPTSGAFRHQVTSSTMAGLKYGFNGLTYFVKDLDVTSITGNAFSYSALTDHNTELSLPNSVTNPQILIVNKTDRLAYASLSSISSTGFTLKKSRTRIGDANAKVDVLIFSGTTLDTYWVDVTMTAKSHNYTLASSPFATDLLSQTIPSSITNLHVDVLSGDDRLIYVTNRSNTGFTLNRSAVTTSSASGSTPVRVCLRKEPNDVYQHRDLVASSLSSVSIDLNGALDDDTNGSVDWPDYVGGLVVSAVPTSDRMSVVDSVSNDTMAIRRSRYGIATTAQATIHGGGRGPRTMPYFTDVATTGVPDTFEGANCKYTLNSALSTGAYHWRVRAGTLT